MIRLETLLKLAPDNGAQLALPRLGEPFEPAHEQKHVTWWRGLDERAGKGSAGARHTHPEAGPLAAGLAAHRTARTMQPRLLYLLTFALPAGCTANPANGGLRPGGLPPGIAFNERVETTGSRA